GPRHCFADEIAIDFPSVGRVVERMRAEFLGEAPGWEVLSTELRLSRRAARSGLTVPLDVPVRGTCPSCSGHGGTWTERCDRCRGTGDSLFQHPVRISVPPGVPDGARLRFRIALPHA